MLFQAKFEGIQNDGFLYVRVDCSKEREGHSVLCYDNKSKCCLLFSAAYVQILNILWVSFPIYCKIAAKVHFRKNSHLRMTKKFKRLESLYVQRKVADHRYWI